MDLSLYPLSGTTYPLQGTRTPGRGSPAGTMFESTCGAPYHPMTQGKIERYHRSMKNVVKLQNYYSPEELERELTHFVDYYNNQRYHESLDNLTPMDVYTGRSKEVLEKRAEIKKQTLQARRLQNLQTQAVQV